MSQSVHIEEGEETMNYTFYTAWPFKYVNGEQTPESVALETAKQPKPLTPYAKVMADPETKESPL